MPRVRPTLIRPWIELAGRLDVDERHNPERGVRNGRGDEQSAGALTEIARPVV